MNNFNPEIDFLPLSPVEEVLRRRKRRHDYKPWFLGALTGVVVFVAWIFFTHPAAAASYSAVHRGNEWITPEEFCSHYLVNN
jgi:hypothetical protein